MHTVHVNKTNLDLENNKNNNKLKSDLNTTDSSCGRNCRTKDKQIDGLLSVNDNEKVLI